MDYAFVFVWQSVTAALNVALLAQEEAEQERRHLRTQLAATMRKMVSVRGLVTARPILWTSH